MVNCFYLATLGCKVNQYESHSLREAWLARGWQEAGDPSEADRIVVNTCAVTAKAVADVRNTVRRLHRAAPAAAIIITGCAAQVMGEELSSLPGVAAVLPQSGKDALLDLTPEGDTGIINNHMLSGKLSKGIPAHFPAFSLSGYDRSRAVLKIQDGCSHGCTYCIVPLTRGRACSREFDASLAEARRLLRNGYREIVISGVNLRQYRQPGGDFWDFLQALDAALAPEWAGQARLRISSLEPGQLTDKALGVLANSRLPAPHLHLSLQSGSASVLRRMGRGHYDPAAIPAFLERLRGIWPCFGLGADILTGFPGETEEEFLEGLAFCRALPLTYAHVFPYSKRPGTRAASMPGQVEPSVRKTRAAVLRELVSEKKRTFLQALLSQPSMRVVFEDRRSGHWQGVNEYYADCRLREKHAASDIRPGELSFVQPVCVQGEELLVDIVALESLAAEA